MSGNEIKDQLLPDERIGHWYKDENKGGQAEIVEIISGETLIRIESGDITKVSADAIVTPINSGGEWYGAIDGAIMRGAGNQFHSIAYEMLPLSHLDTVVARKTHDHNCGFSNVVFVIDDLEGPLNEVILNGLLAADKVGYKSVTLPTMRMGVMMGKVEKTKEETIQQMKIGVANFLKQSPKNLKKITFVVYNDAETQEILKETFNIA